MVSMGTVSYSTLVGTHRCQLSLATRPAADMVRLMPEKMCTDYTNEYVNNCIYYLSTSRVEVGG